VDYIILYKNSVVLYALSSPDTKKKPSTYTFYRGTSLLSLNRTIFNSLRPISTAIKLTVMHFFSKKIPGYALASTFVALGGMLNGYVLKETVLLLDTFYPLSLNLVLKLIRLDFLEKTAFFPFLREVTLPWLVLMMLLRIVSNAENPANMATDSIQALLVLLLRCPRTLRPLATCRLPCVVLLCL